MGMLSKVKWVLLGCLIIVFVLVASSVFVPNGLINTVQWLASNDFATKLRPPSEREVLQEDTLIEMVVERVVTSQINYQSVIILKEKDGELLLPIWIGLVEGDAIWVILEEVEVPRPLTPDLLCSILDRMEARVDCIVINDFKNQIFYAKISVNANWTQMNIDSRPSDAIAIALRVNAPIYVEKSVLDKAGIQPEQETERYTLDCTPMVGQIGLVLPRKDGVVIHCSPA